LCRIKHSVFASSNRIYDEFVESEGIEHLSLQFSSAVYHAAYTYTQRKKESTGERKLQKVHEYPWMCEKVRRDLVYLKAKSKEKPGVRPTSISNPVACSIFSKRN